MVLVIGEVSFLSFDSFARQLVAFSKVGMGRPFMHVEHSNSRAVNHTAAFSLKMLRQFLESAVVFLGRFSDVQSCRDLPELFRNF